MCVFSYVSIYFCICVESPGQTKNDTGLIFGTHTRIDLNLKRIFCFAEKIIVTAARQDKTAVSRRFSAYLLDCLVYRITDPSFLDESKTEINKAIEETRKNKCDAAVTPLRERVYEISGFYRFSFGQEV